MLLLTQFILFRVEPLIHWLPVHGTQVLIVYLLFVILILVTRFISWQLSEEFLRAGHRRIHLIIFCGYKQTGKALQHNDVLLHVFAITKPLLLR